MELFDVENYQLPEVTAVDLEKTIEKLAIFLRSYKVARERVGVSILPKMTDSFNLSFEEFSDLKEKKLSAYYQEYIRLHQLFVIGFSAIVHAFRPEISIRRKQIFMLRYVYGLSIPLVSERVHYQKNIIVDDSKIAVIQFSDALSLLVMKE
ncbi:transcriptional regulator, ArpU family protein [Enterococcus avium]|uniref:transcriptional regulator, ArpU family protein n=1 Tax=Enterococcus avium TaxID=33945 RepID=UPI001D08297E|nr:transcriptional regulator, ArpU family protein [Enterococcus avium]MCB6916165.1 transcriptional regulator, ArpU family protein [Enterococcus avium]MCQ4960022.1 transcriptional regulator, ArpU family protein [Enterococcus avium]